MDIISNKMGRVRPVPEGEHDAGRDYRMLSIVYSNQTNKSYISKQDVPAGINIDNKIYWQVFGNGKFVDNAIINVSYLEDSIVPHTLAEAISMVAEEDRRPGIVLAFFEKESNYDEGNAWILYQFKGSSIDDWDKQQYWTSVYNRENKFKGWFLNSTELVERWPNPFKGDYAYVGQNLNNSWIWRCNDDGSWSKTSERFTNNAIINYYGDISNNPDFEDIDADEQNRLKFADREPNENEMGCVILRKNKTFAEQVIKENTIYEIRYNFDLDNQSIEIPNNCILKFNGGNLINGTLIGSNTQIFYNSNGIFTNIKISGIWNVPEIRSSIFTDCVNNDVIKSLFALQNSNIYNTIIVEKTDLNYLVSYTSSNIISIRDNTKVILDGHIKLQPNSENGYNIFNIVGNNIMICGSGKIEGDKDEHIYGIETAEHGHGIRINSNSKDIIIEGIEIFNCIGDGIYQKSSCKDIIIRNIIIHDCRRQGITIQGIENLIIENFKIYNIAGTNPQSAIDIEPNKGEQAICKGIIIQNGIIDNVQYGIITVATDDADEDRVFKDIVLSNITLTNSLSTGIQILKFESAKITNCNIATRVYGMNIQKTATIIENCKVSTTEVDRDGSYVGTCLFNVCGTDTLIIVKNSSFTGYNAVRTLNGLSIENCNITTTSNFCQLITGNASPIGIIINSNIICAIAIQTKASLIIKNNNITCRNIALGAASTIEQNVLIGTAASAVTSFIGPDVDNGQRLVVRDNIITVPDAKYRYIIQLLASTKSVVYGNNITGHNTDGRFIGTSAGNYAINFSGFAGTGATSGRPVFDTANVGDDSVIGICFYDTTLNKPVWHKGNNVWVDATGTVV